MARTRLLVQTSVNAEEAGKAYDAYLKTVYPFSKEVKKEEDRKLMEKVAREVSRGPIMFRPINPVAATRHTPIQSMPKGVADALRKGGKPRLLR